MSFDDAWSAVLAEHPDGWSDWQPFSVGALNAPAGPGVYVVRNRDDSAAYVGAALRRPAVMRLRDYLVGNDLNGLAERAMDASLSDPEWLRERLDSLLAGDPPRSARQWMKDALQQQTHLISSRACSDGASAKALERDVERILRTRSALWER